MSRSLNPLLAPPAVPASLPRCLPLSLPSPPFIPRPFSPRHSGNQVMRNAIIVVDIAQTGLPGVKLSVKRASRHSRHPSLLFSLLVRLLGCVTAGWRATGGRLFALKVSGNNKKGRCRSSRSFTVRRRKMDGCGLTWTGGERQKQWNAKSPARLSEKAPPSDIFLP